MKKLNTLIIALLFLLGSATVIHAQKSESMIDGDEGTVEETAAVEGELDETAGTAEEAQETNPIFDTIQAYIDENTSEGTYQLEDTEGNSRNLTFVNLHEGISENEGVSTLCVDFQDSESGELIDVDFDVQEIDGSTNVSARLHKVVETAMAEEEESTASGDNTEENLE